MRLRQGFIEEEEESFQFKNLMGDKLNKINQIGDRVQEIQLLKTETLIKLFPEKKHLSSLEELHRDNYRPSGKHNVGSDLINYLFLLYEPFGEQSLAASSTTNVSQSIWDYYNVTEGFLNGTQLLAQPHAILCNNVVVQYLQIGVNNIPADAKNTSKYSTYDWIYDIANIFTYLYPLQKNCYLGYYEMAAFTKIYSSGYYNFMAFSDTFAYNFGLMYDSLITAFESIQLSNYYMAGYSFGNMVYMVFYIA